MTPHDMVEWSRGIHQLYDSERDDAASFAIEKYLPKAHSFTSDSAAFRFLNVCFKRKHKDERAKLRYTVPIDSIGEREVLSDMERVENIEFIHEMLNLLPLNYKCVLIKTLEGKSPEEIAREEEISLDCFYQRKRRAEKHLRQLIKKELSV